MSYPRYGYHDDLNEDQFLRIKELERVIGEQTTAMKRAESEVERLERKCNQEIGKREALLRTIRLQTEDTVKLGARLGDQTSYAEAFRAALASIAYQMSDDGFNSESAAVVRATAQGIAKRALIKNQRHGADSPASQVSDPSTSASSAHGVTTPADSAPSDVRSEVAQSAPATNAPLTERFKLVPIDPTDAMVDAACRDVGLCDGDAKDEELRQEYRVAYRAMVGDAPEAIQPQMGQFEREALEQECADVDRLLAHLGIRIEQGRSEGGRLLVAKIASILEERGVKIERGRPVPPHTTGPAVYTGNDRG